MNNIIEQMLNNYVIKNTNDEVNALKEIIQELVLSGLSRGGFFDEAAFYDCIKLFSIALPEGVTSIGRNAFDGCHSLTNITIPSSVKTIGTDAFTYCWDLTNITIQKGSPLNTSSANYPWGASASKIIFEQ